jgi:hypothetical protein
MGEGDVEEIVSRDADVQGVEVLRVQRVQQDTFVLGIGLLLRGEGREVPPVDGGVSSAGAASGR